MDNTYSANVESTSNYSEIKKRIEPGKLKRILITVGIMVVAVFYLPRLILQPARISVTGIGKVSVVPKKVSLIATIINSSPISSVAIEAGEENLTALINETKMIVGEDAEIQKSFYSISQVKGQQVVGGQLVTVNSYEVTNGFKVTFNQVDKVDEVIKSLYAKGASSVSNISFIPENEDEVQQEARQLAIKDAREEGKKIAKSMGKILGKVTTLADDQVEAASTISSSEGRVGSEQVDITKSVSIVYEVW